MAPSMLWAAAVDSGMSPPLFPVAATTQADGSQAGVWVVMGCGVVSSGTAIMAPGEVGFSLLTPALTLLLSGGMAGEGGLRLDSHY